MKKFLAIMLILSMVFSMSTGMAFAETTAEENQNTELVWTNCGDDVQYALDETSGTLTIQGNGSISSFPFENDTASLRKIKTVYIGSGITGISATAKNTSYKKNFIDYLNAYCDGNFTSIEVEEGNAVYCAQDGVLYSADMTTLLAYPANKPDTEFSIPETVERIGYYSYNQERFDCPFYYVHQIEKMYVPAKTNLYFGSYWVFGEKSAKYPYFEVSEDNEKYTSVDGVLFTKDMKTICAYPYYKTDLSSYTIPDTVTTIENRAFNNCDFLTEIILPDGLRTIKYWGFAEAHGLKNLTIPSRVTSIGSNGRSWAFVNCRSLETLIFESDSLLSDIPDGMCSGVSSLNTVVLGDNILTIGDRAFYGCTGLSEIIIPSSVYEIGANSFTNCPALRAVVHEDSYGLDYVQQKGIAYVIEGNLDSVTLTMENTIISEIENQNYTGTAIKPDPSVIYTDADSNTKVLKKGIDYTVAYENNVNPGTAGITIKGKGNYNGTLTAYFEIVEASHEITQENAVVYAGGSALEGRRFTYSGQPVIPNDISLMVDGVKVEEQYYDVICTNNINTGTAKIQVIGKSGYAGSAESYYSIIARSIGSCAISNLAGKYSYTGGPITPNVTISISSGYPDYVRTTLKEGRDYTVTYSNNVNITTATSKAAITFSAIEGGNFTGSMQTTFDIVHGAGYGITDGDTLEWTKCGENVYYNFNSTSGELKLSGNGCVGNQPWIENGWDDQIRILTIGSYITGIQSLDIYQREHYKNLEHIQVEEGNSNLIAAEGVLYNFDQTELLAYPAASKMTEFTIPETVRHAGYYTFENCQNLSSVNLPASLKSLPSFRESKALQNVHIAEGSQITSVQNQGFRNCTSLTSINLPETVNRIQSYAFQNCAELQSVGDNAQIAYVGNYAFDYCVKMQSIHLVSPADGGYGEIGYAAFRHCEALQQIDIPKVAFVQQRAFQSCLGLERVTVSDGAEQIYNEAFRNCRKLKTISLPDSVKYIGGRVFRYCVSLESVDMPENLDYIGNEAFYHCESLKSIKIPRSTDPAGRKQIYPNTFAYCKLLETVEMEDDITEIGYRTFYHNDALSSIHLSNELTVIRDNAFAFCGTLREIDIPDSVKTIGGSAFRSCSSLEQIKLPSSLTEMGWSVFWNCTALEEMEIPGSLKTLSNRVFSGCYNLKKVILDEGITTIGSNAFSSARGIESIQLPQSLQAIANYAFSNCTSLHEILIPDGVNAIGSGAFWNCRGLESVKLPAGITEINNSVFQNCTSLQSIDIPDGVTRIGQYAFYGCSLLEEAMIPESVRIIEKGVFRNCSALQNIQMPNTLENLGGGAFADSGLKEIHIPASLTEISPETFAWTKISSADIPDNVRSVGYSAFEGCTNLTSVNLNQVETIGECAFAEDNELTYVHIPDTITLLDLDSFRINNLKVAFEGGIPELNQPFADSAKLLYLCDKAESDSQIFNYTAFPVHRFSEGICSVCGKGLTDTEETGDSDFCLYPIDKTKNQYLMFNRQSGEVIDKVYFEEKPSEIIVPDSIDGVFVTEIYNILGDSELTKLTIPISAELERGVQPNNIREFVFTAGDGTAFDYDEKTYTETPWYLGRKNGISITLSEGVKRIGNYMFANQLLTSCDLPSTLEEIGNNAFYRNGKLKTVGMQEGMKKIGYSAFAECELLEEVTLPASLTNMKYNAFAGDEELVATVYENTYGASAAKKYGLTYKVSEAGTIITPPESEKEAGQILVTNGYSRPGASVEIPVYLKENHGMTMLTLGMEFDREVLELTDVVNGDVFEEGSLTVDRSNLASAEKLLWSNSTNKTDIENTGKLVVLKFKVKESASAGKYTIGLTCSESSGAYDSSGKIVKFNTIGGNIIVQDFLYGDMTADGVINIMDAPCLKYYLASFTGYKDMDSRPGDIDLDGEVTLRDLMILERYLAEWKGYDSLPIIGELNSVS